MKFINTNDVYRDPYTSELVQPNTSSSTRGVIQVNIKEVDITVELQARVSNSAPWFTVKEYTEDTIEEIVLAPSFRVVTTGHAEVWLVETR